MSRFIPDAEAARLGEALAALRRERGLSQAEAGGRLGMTSQAWGLYETGRRSGLFRPDVQRRLTGALDATAEDLAFALARDGAPAPVPAPAQISGRGVESRARAYDPGPVVVGRLQLSDDALAPWAASGVVLEYRAGQWPRRGQGCVIQMADGAVRARLYDGADERTVTVFGANGLDRSETIERVDIVRMSAVIARHEG